MVISTTIGAFERMWAQSTCFYFEVRGISLLIRLATLSVLTMVFSLVRAIALDTSGALDTAWHSSMSPSPKILALGDTWIHISSLNSCDKSFYIKAPINKTFSLTTALNISNFNPNNQHIELGWNFDDSRFWCKNNIVEDLILFNNTFHIIRSKTFIGWVMGIIEDAYDFQVGFRLR